MLNWRPTCLILDPLETDMPYRRSTCLIIDLNMLHWRPIGDRNAPSEIHWRPTFLVGDQHALLESLHYSNINKQKLRVHENFIIIRDLSETHQRPIGDPLKIDMPDRRLIGTVSETDMPDNNNIFLNSSFYTFRLFIYFGILYWGMRVSDGSSMKHVEVSDQACWSPMGLR